MITAIISTLNHGSRLNATLATLAPAAIDALVREVIIADGGSTDDTVDLALDAGAKVMRGEPDRVLGQACAAAGQPWLLILPAGARLEVGWEAAVRGHIRRHPAAGGWFRLNRAELGIGPRIQEIWADGAARWFGRPRPEQGLLIASGRWADPHTPSFRLGARILIGAG